MTCSYCGESSTRKEAVLCHCGAAYCAECASGLGEDLVEEQESEDYIGEVVSCPRCQGRVRGVKHG